MISEFRRNAAGAIQPGTAFAGVVGEGLVWLDALNPEGGELDSLRQVVGIDIPDKREMAEIELSNRLYRDDGALVMIGSFLPKSSGWAPPPRPATFILKDGLLLTVRFCEFPSFDRAWAAVPRDREVRTAFDIFSRLMEEAVSDRADSLEYLMRHMEALTSRLFSPEAVSGKIDTSDSILDSVELEEVLRGIGMMGEQVSNIRESIASLQRMLNFARAHISEERLKEVGAVIDSLKNDLTALSDEASFFMNKLAFNLDATLGMINVEETKVIRLLSIVTLLLTPPMVIGGIYGMNFHFMPELAWRYGYMFALGLMAATAGASIWYLRRKRWF